jgi:AAA ATPase domain
MLRGLLQRTAAEGLRFALVGGEAGSGKSRLVSEFAHEAAAEGALVLYGACDSVVRRPYRPFVEALDQLVRDTDAQTLRAALGPDGSAGCFPTWRSGSAAWRRRWRPIPTPNATACTARSPIFSPPSAGERHWSS